MNPLHWRKMTWLLLIFTAVMFIWAVSAVNSEACSQYAQGTTARDNCELGEDIGTGIGVVFLFFVWLVGFFVLSVIWYMTRGATDRARRICPVCGTQPKTGQTVCKKCGYDFAAAAQSNAPYAPIVETTGRVQGANSVAAIPLANPGAKQCTSCGEMDIPSSSRFCPSCGIAI